MSEDRQNPNEQQMMRGQYTYQGQPNYYYPPSSPAYYPPHPLQQSTQAQQNQMNVQGMLPIEQSYIENILRLNKGKKVTVYMTFEQNKEWNAKVFKGVIEAAGKDHITLSDPEARKRYLLPMIFLNYVVFDE